MLLATSRASCCFLVSLLPCLSVAFVRGVSLIYRTRSGSTRVERVPRSPARARSDRVVPSSGVRVGISRGKVTSLSLVTDTVTKLVSTLSEIFSIRVPIRFCIGDLISPSPEVLLPLIPSRSFAISDTLATALRKVLYPVVESCSTEMEPVSPSNCVVSAWVCVAPNALAISAGS